LRLGRLGAAVLHGYKEDLGGVESKPRRLGDGGYREVRPQGGGNTGMPWLRGGSSWGLRHSGWGWVIWDEEVEGDFGPKEAVV
jgi:hypothetical protein